MWNKFKNKLLKFNRIWNEFEIYDQMDRSGLKWTKWTKVALDDTDDLFVEADSLGDGESAPVPPVTDSANQPVPEVATQSIIKAAIQPVTETEQAENISTQT